MEHCGEVKDEGLRLKLQQARAVEMGLTKESTRRVTGFGTMLLKEMGLKGDKAAALSEGLDAVAYLIDWGATHGKEG